MRIYFSGIGGVGIGPLAEISVDAGYDVLGSDQQESMMTHQLEERNVAISCDQSGDFLRESHAKTPIDWYVYTSALPDDHPELTVARQLGLHTAKRDELLAHIIDEKDLKLIAVAGTHGKTTTTGMMVWTMQQLGIPVSYSVGTTLSWAPSGVFDPDSKYFVYECDEFDRNFLHFSPYLSLITSIEHDHPDTYPTESDYFEAFSQFAAASQQVIMWDDDAKHIETSDVTWQLGDNEVQDIKIPGAHNRRNATLVAKGIEYLSAHDKRMMASEAAPKNILSPQDGQKFSGADLPTRPAIFLALEFFPGTNRRFEKLANNLYTDYGHHPSEIQATLQMAHELSDHVVLVYQPHQNIRQHEVRSQYTDEVFKNANDIYWLPTYLSREDPGLEVLTPEQLTENLSEANIHISELDDKLLTEIQNQHEAGHLVLCMGAGTIDSWLRDALARQSI